MKPRASKRKDRHLIPKKGDAVYIDGHWVTRCKYEQCPGAHYDSCFGGCCYPVEIWIRPTRTRVNGIIIYVDYEDHEVRIHWTDHPYADPEEDKITSMDFSTLYGQWSSKKECYVVQESDV